MDNAKVLKEGLEKTGQFNIISKDVGVPLVAFTLKDSSKHTVFDISESLRRFGWIVPAYTMPPNAENISVLRVVIREDFSRTLAERLVSDIQKVMKDMFTLITTGCGSHVSTTTTAHVKPAGEENQDSEEKGTHQLKKNVKKIEEEITKHWRRLVDQRRTGIC